MNSGGGVSATAAGGVGGFNGGGDGGSGVSNGGGGGGGGMSAVVRGSTTLVVAGGGGGSGTETDVGVGGDGGGDGTDGGTPSSGPPNNPSGGQAGGASGAAGVSVGTGITQPTAGTAGQGGTGGSSDSFQGGGGGGGGATGGGGGGASGSGTGSNSAGGGGGSGSGPAGTVFANGVQEGDGSVVITWDPAAGGCTAPVTPGDPGVGRAERTDVHRLISDQHAMLSRGGRVTRPPRLRRNEHRTCTNAVPGVGFEPTCPEGRPVLSRLRQPVAPSGRTATTLVRRRRREVLRCTGASSVANGSTGGFSPGLPGWISKCRCGPVALPVMPT